MRNDPYMWVFFVSLKMIVGKVEICNWTGVTDLYGKYIHKKGKAALNAQEINVANPL